MNGNNFLLDTNVIIFAAKELINFELLVANSNKIAISIITYMELFGTTKMQQLEYDFLYSFCSAVKIIDVDKTIADEVISIRNKAAKKIKLPDAIILATAKTKQYSIITDNIEDFLDIDKNVIIENIEKYKIKQTQRPL